MRRAEFVSLVALLGCRSLARQVLGSCSAGGLHKCAAGIVRHALTYSCPNVRRTGLAAARSLVERSIRHPEAGLPFLRGRPAGQVSRLRTRTSMPHLRCNNGVAPAALRRGWAAQRQPTSRLLLHLTASHPQRLRTHPDAPRSSRAPSEQFLPLRPFSSRRPSCSERPRHQQPIHQPRQQQPQHAAPPGGGVPGADDGPGRRRALAATGAAPAAAADAKPDPPE